MNDGHLTKPRKIASVRAFHIRRAFHICIAREHQTMHPQRMQRGAVGCALKITDVREGNILIMLGPLPWASIVCCCGLSWGSSHVGQVVCLNEQLWLAESTPHMSNPRANFTQLLRPGAGPIHDGVCASKLEDNFAYFNAIDVYRPIGITQSDLVKMRYEFLRLYGSPYEPVVDKFVTRGCAVAGCGHVHARCAYNCSDLTYHLFKTIGHVNADSFCCVFGDDFMRPYDITRVIACDRVGHADGAYAIGDPRSFICSRT